MPAPTPVAPGPFALASEATAAHGIDVSYQPDDALNVFYLSGIVICLPAATIKTGGAGIPITLNVTSTNSGRIVQSKLGGVQALAGLTGLGTGTLQNEGTILSVPLFDWPTTANDIIAVIADQTDSVLVNVTLLGRCGPPPASLNQPSLLVAGVSGAQALAVSVDTSATPLIVQGKVGGVPQPVSVDTSTTPLVVQGKVGGVAQPVAISSGTVTVDTTTPLAVKTTGTNTVKVIPG